MSLLLAPDGRAKILINMVSGEFVKLPVEAVVHAEQDGFIALRCGPEVTWASDHLREETYNMSGKFYNIVGGRSVWLHKRQESCNLGCPVLCMGMGGNIVEAGRV